MALRPTEIAGELLEGESERGANQIENRKVERGGFEKKRVNPPIDAIKDRLIEGFGGKSKSQTSIPDSGIKAG